MLLHRLTDSSVPAYERFDALGRLGPPETRPAALQAAVARLAQCAPAQDLRLAALSHLGPAAPTPPLRQCPRGPLWARGLVVHEPGATVELLRPRHAGSSHRSPEGRHSPWTLGDLTFVGVDRGEWGGSLTVSRAGQTVFSVHDSFLNPLGVLAWRQDLMVVSGVDHMMGFGQLYRVSQDAGAHWALKKVVDLNAKPEAWALGAEALYVATRPATQQRPCGESADRDAPVITAVMPDGRTALVPNEATTCLFGEAQPALRP